VFFVTDRHVYLRLLPGCGNGSHGQMIDEGEGVQPGGYRLSAIHDRAGFWKTPALDAGGIYLDGSAAD
jgi:hypothetical protein